ncbi:MAG: FAD-dependent oxidoreductase [Thermoanaerobaculum sp.]|nr:FAD-dependent oxidoreductase [Thermoanaerobaculum sp.]
MGSPSTDVLVLGAGSAGAAAALILARKGFSVTVVDQDPKLPGVPGVLLPSPAWAWLQSLGIWVEEGSDLSSHPCGGLSLAGPEGTPRSFWPTADSRSGCPTARLARREDLRRRLLAELEQTGVQLLRGWEAITPVWQGKRLVGVRLRTPMGEETVYHCRVFLDASGQRAFLATRMGWRFPYPKHRKRAEASLFRGTLPEDPGTPPHLALVCFPLGWFWFLPLGPDCFTAGVVVEEDAPAAPVGSPGALFFWALEQCPEASRLAADAEPLLPFLSLSGFSYRVTKLAGEGFGLVGDAAGFFDPFPFAGISVALETGALAAEDVAEALARRGRVEAHDLAPTVATTRHFQRTLSGLARALYHQDFLALLLANSPRWGASETMSQFFTRRWWDNPWSWHLWRWNKLRLLAWAQGLGRTLGVPLVPPLPWAQGR